MKDKISLYIPTKESGRHICRCLTGILHQTLRPDEIIIVDGNSKDDTLKKARSMLAVCDIRHRIIQQDGRGLANARNIAVRSCTYDLIASIDSDCVPEKGWLKELQSGLGANIGAGGRLIELNQEKLPDRWRNAHLRQDWGMKKLQNPRFLYGSCSLISKKAIQDAGFYDERFMTNFEDVDLSRRLRRFGSLIYLPDAICSHLRTDSMESLVKMYYSWHLNGYRLPTTLPILMMRLLITNPYRCMRLMATDIARLRLDFISIDLSTLVTSQKLDFAYYINNKS